MFIIGSCARNKFDSLLASSGIGQPYKTCLTFSTVLSVEKKVASAVTYLKRNSANGAKRVKQAKEQIKRDSETQEKKDEAAKDEAAAL